MASVNKVIPVGNVGRDPEMRYLPDGKAACSISVATSSRRKDRNTGEVVEDTQWHRVQFFDRLAEVVGDYVKKGGRIYVEGRLRYGKYTGTDGVERNTCDVIATELQLLSGREQGDGQASAPAPRAAAPAPRAAAPARAPAPAQRPGGASGFDDMDDDIPF